MTDSSDYSQKGGRKKRPPRQRKPVQGNPDADPVNVHRDYVERRMWSGDEVETPEETDAETVDRPSTPDRYARAAEQWHRLPGAVRTPATEVRGDDPDAGTDDDNSTEQEPS